MDCPFCEIAAGTRRATVSLRTDRFLVFESISRADTAKYLVVPKLHYAAMQDVPLDVLSEWLRTAQVFADSKSIQSYRVQINVGSQFQNVRHLHMQFSEIGARHAKRYPSERQGDRIHTELPEGLEGVHRRNT